MRLSETFVLPNAEMVFNCKCASINGLGRPYASFLYSFARKEELRSSAIPLGQVLQQHGPNAAADLLIPGGKSRKQAFVGTGLPPFPLGVYIYIYMHISTITNL